MKKEDSVQEVATQEKKGFSLPQKKITVEPIFRSSGWINDPEHEAFFLCGTSTINFSAPRDRVTGEMICPLTEEERAFFENKELSGMSFEKGELSPYRKDNNYWLSKEAKVRLNKDKVELDLSNPYHYIRYKILLVNTDLVAPSPDKAMAKKSYKYMIVEENYQMAKRLNKTEKLKEAYKFYGKIEDSIDEMETFLKIYGKKVPSTASKTWLQDKISEIMETDLDGFLQLAANKDRNVRLFVDECVTHGIIIRENHKYFLQGGEKLSFKTDLPLIDNVVKFLTAPVNSDLYLELQERLKHAKE
jgi:hypothetical protein